ncbi:MAG: NUDIX domain-containing protein, partial [Clostridiales bacterium]|nr:NUDIX domain-containing protein [Clostridiales bacterium]
MIDKILKLKDRKPDISDKNYYVTSSILIPLVKNGNDISILFEVRSNSLKKQPNEICFPGGRIENDESELSAAIRETSEELCLDP